MIEERPIISLKNVKINYRNTKPTGYRTFLKRILKKPAEEKANYFTAVDGVTFNMYKGETVGIVGANGSGKSTLLRAIAGIYGIDGGHMRINCDRTSLLALGVGFQSRLPGRTNIYLSGYAMGFSKEEIEAKMDEIIEFSELGDFIDKVPEKELSQDKRNDQRLGQERDNCFPERRPAERTVQQSPLAQQQPTDDVR